MQSEGLSSLSTKTFFVKKMFNSDDTFKQMGSKTKLRELGLREGRNMQKLH